MLGLRLVEAERSRKPRVGRNTWGRKGVKLASCPEWLELDRLTELSDAAAEALSKHKGGRLSLDGLTKLSDAAADSLSKYEGKINFKDPKEWVESKCEDDY